MEVSETWLLWIQERIITTLLIQNSGEPDSPPLFVFPRNIWKFHSLIRIFETASLRYSRSEKLKIIWFFIRLFVSLQAKKQKKGIMRVGDNVLISPDVTHKSDWQIATVIEVEENPFVGTVISARTEDGEIFFDKAYLFKPAN